MDFEDELADQVTSVILYALVSAAERFGFPPEVALDIGNGFQRVILKRKFTPEEASTAATQVHGLLGRTSGAGVASSVDGWEAFIETVLDQDMERDPQLSLDFRDGHGYRADEAPIGFCLDCSNLIWPVDLGECSKCALDIDKVPNMSSRLMGGFGIRCQKCKYLISNMDDPICQECEQAWDSPS